MTDLGSMIVKYTADISDLTAKSATAKTEMSGVGQAASGMGTVVAGGLALAGTAIVAIGAKSVKMAGDFQSSMTALVTGAGESAGNLKMVSDGILNLATSTGATTQDLAAGMYNIESAGYHGAQGLAVLTASAQGAKVGNASLADVSNGVTTAMTDYSASGLTAAQATNTLIATVASGKTHMADLSNAFSTILPTSAAVGVSLTDTSGAMATMTGEGTDAASAATYLRQLLMALESPGTQAASTLKSLGISTQQVSDGMKKSLPDTLQMITDHLKKKFPEGSAAYVSALKDIAGGSKQMQGILELTGQHMQVFQGNVTTITDSVKKGGNAIVGWDLVQKDWNTTLDRAKQVLDTLMIKLGTALLPILTSVTNNVIPIVQNFQHLADKGTFLGGVIDTLKKAWAGIMQYLQSDTFAGVVADFQSLGTQIGLLISPLQGVQGPAGDLASNILPTLGTTIKNLIDLVDQIVFPLSEFVMALNQGNPWAQAFAAALVGVGVAMLVIKAASIVSVVMDFISILPIIIGLTWGWVAGLTAAAIEMVIATWPIIAIGAAIAAVVAIIILAVQHWGDIVKWLQGAWSNIVSFFTGLWHNIQNIFSGIGKWFSDTFTNAKNAIGNAFSGLGSVLHQKGEDAKNGFQTAMGNIGNWFSDRGKDIQKTAQLTGQGVVDAGNWMYQHNTYWKIMVDGMTAVIHNVQLWLKQTWKTISDDATSAWNAIAGWATSAWNAVSGAIETAAKAVWDWLVMAWNTIKGWLTTAWHAIASVATTVWNAVTGAIKAGVTIAWNWLVSVWTTISGWLSAQWNKFTTMAAQVWAAVSNVFAGIWTNYIAKPLTTLWNQISGWFTNLGKGAQQSGQNFINMLVTGIQNGAGAIWNAVTGIANTIWKALGFHSPPAGGPLADSDKYMPRFIDILSTGLNAGAPKVATAAGHVASQISYPIKPSATAIASSVAPTLIAQNTGGDHTTIVQIDSREMARLTQKATDKQVRLKLGPKGRTA